MSDDTQDPNLQLGKSSDAYAIATELENTQSDVYAAEASPNLIDEVQNILYALKSGTALNAADQQLATDIQATTAYANIGTANSPETQALPNRFGGGDY